MPSTTVAANPAAPTILSQDSFNFDSIRFMVQIKYYKSKIIPINCEMDSYSRLTGF